MDQLSNFQIPEGKVFKESQLRLATFLGGPLAAGHIFSENYKTFGMPEKRKNTWLITVGFSILLVAVILLIPENSKFPNYVIPLLYTILAGFLMNFYQGGKIKAHLQMGGKSQSWWTVILISIISLVAFVIIVVGAVLLVNPK